MYQMEENYKEVFFTLECVDNVVLLFSGEKSHECEICSKKFTQLSSLRSHIKIHTGKFFCFYD